MPAPIRGPWYNRPGWSEYKAARGGGQKHWGYDSYCAPRSTIYAIGEGRVVARSTTATTQYGFYVDVFYPGLNVRQREAHMNERSPLPIGTPVTSSTALGRVGRTGNAKNIYWIRNGVELWHVHSQAWRGNSTNGDNNVDPRNYWGGTASDDITPIPEEKPETVEEEDDMKPDIIGHENEEVAVLAPWLPNGYLTAKVGTQVAIGWSRLYSPTKNSLVPKFDRATYLGMIEGAKALAAGYQAALPTDMPAAGASVDLTPVLDAIANVPTADQNGQAARHAIVK